jgi:hypothetical protein
MGRLPGVAKAKGMVVSFGSYVGTKAVLFSKYVNYGRIYSLAGNPKIPAAVRKNLRITPLTNPAFEDELTRDFTRECEYLTEDAGGRSLRPHEVHPGNWTADSRQADGFPMTNGCLILAQRTMDLFE